MTRTHERIGRVVSHLLDATSFRPKYASSSNSERLVACSGDAARAFGARLRSNQTLVSVASDVEMDDGSHVQLHPVVVDVDALSEGLPIQDCALSVARMRCATALLDKAFESQFGVRFCWFGSGNGVHGWLFQVKLGRSDRSFLAKTLFHRPSARKFYTELCEANSDFAALVSELFDSLATAWEAVVHRSNVTDVWFANRMQAVDSDPTHRSKLDVLLPAKFDPGPLKYGSLRLPLTFNKKKGANDMFSGYALPPPSQPECWSVINSLRRLNDAPQSEADLRNLDEMLLNLVSETELESVMDRAYRFLKRNGVESSSSAFTASSSSHPFHSRVHGSVP